MAPAGLPVDPRNVLEAMLGVPFTDGNLVEVLRNGDEAFPAMLAEIRRCTRSIDLLWFLWGKGAITGEVAAVLAERARAGVRVRVLLDAFGSKGTERALVRDMRGAGCQVGFYHPVNWRVTALNLRTHRRVLVCDETVAFTGGIGIDQAWTGDASTPANWRDNGYRVQGPAVAGIRSAFAMAWVQGPDALVTPADEFPALAAAGRAAVQVLRPSSMPGLNDAAVAVIALLYLADHRVRIATPYSRLPRRLRDLVTETARRGVHVQLLVPGPHVDRRLIHVQGQHEYQRLLDAGVEIWQFQPTMLHTKIMTVDSRFALVGTTNLDARSVALNEQVGLVIDDPETVAVLDGHYDDDVNRSTRLDPAQWAARPAKRRMAESIATTAGFPLRGLGSAGLWGRRP